MTNEEHKLESTGITTEIHGWSCVRISTGIQFCWTFQQTRVQVEWFHAKRNNYVEVWALFKTHGGPVQYWTPPAMGIQSIMDSQRNQAICSTYAPPFHLGKPKKLWCWTPHVYLEAENQLIQGGLTLKNEGTNKTPKKGTHLKPYTTRGYEGNIKEAKALESCPKADQNFLQDGAKGCKWVKWIEWIERIK